MGNRMTGENAQRRAQDAQRSITAAMLCPLCPEVTEEAGAYLLAHIGKRPKYRTGTDAARARAAELVEDATRRNAVMAWIDAYNQEHGHGPAWHIVCADPQLWAQDVPTTIRQLMLKAMLGAGYLQGSQIPYGLRVSRRPGNLARASGKANVCRA